MFDALHPNQNKIISYADYLIFSLDNSVQNVNDALGARCPVCERRMKVRAGKTKDDGHFYHNDDLFCPSKNPAQRPYLNLQPNQIDQNAVIENRNFVRGNMQKIWSRVNEIVPFLDLKEFIEILLEATRLNIYGYANLTPELIPYIYVTLINFLPSKSKDKKRNLKFCFFYESTINTYEDLWIDQGAFSRLTRISYHKGSTNKVKTIETSNDYLNECKYTLSEKQLEWCLRNL